MSLRSFISCILLALTIFIQACGFTPVHGHTNRNNAQQLLLASVEVGPIKQRNGQVFKATLEDSLNPTHHVTPARYRLTMSLTVDESSLAIERDRTISRYQIITRATYVLTDIATDTILRKGVLKRESGYDKTESEYATFVSETESVDKSLRALAKDLSMVVTSSVIRHASSPDKKLYSKDFKKPARRFLEETP